MSDDPQLEDVREWYIAGRRTHNPFASDAALVESFDTWRAALVERYDTWLAEHDREVAAQALRDAAGSGIPRRALAQGTRDWLRARADQIEEGR